MQHTLTLEDFEFKGCSYTADIVVESLEELYDIEFVECSLKKYNEDVDEFFSVDWLEDQDFDNYVLDYTRTLLMEQYDDY